LFDQQIRRLGRKATEVWWAFGEQPAGNGLTIFRDTMRLPCLRIGAAALVGAAVVIAAASPVLAQGAEAKPTDQRAPAADNRKDANKKIDEYAEAERHLGGPAGNPECVWLGQRVVSRLWNDDLDQAFRHLDLYDRFGCPSGHIQTAFRCLVRKDPKAQDVLNAQIKDCWLNPDTDPLLSQPAAAAATVPSQAQ
jgi:hypothetical protein